MTERKITSEPDKNFRLIGIATSERDYRLCFMLSEAMDWEDHPTAQSGDRAQGALAENVTKRIQSST
jgi:hypothetical protein